MSGFLDQFFDESGRAWARQAGVFEPESLAEFGPMLEALNRGKRPSSLRLLAVFCGGPRNHTVCEIYPPDVVLTRYFVRDENSGGEVLPGDRLRDRLNGRVRIEPVRSRAAETVSAAAKLSDLAQPGPEMLEELPDHTYFHGRRFLRLECCVRVALETSWLAAILESGRRNVAVPDAMRLSTQMAADAAFDAVFEASEAAGDVYDEEKDGDTPPG